MFGNSFESLSFSHVLEFLGLDRQCVVICWGLTNDVWSFLLGDLFQEPKKRMGAWNPGWSKWDPMGRWSMHVPSELNHCRWKLPGSPGKKTVLTNGYMHHHPSHVGCSHKIYVARDMFGSPTIHALHVKGSCNMILLQILVLIVKWSIKFLHKLAKRFALYYRSPAQLSFVRFSLDHPNLPGEPHEVPSRPALGMFKKRISSSSPSDKMSGLDRRWRSADKSMAYSDVYIEVQFLHTHNVYTDVYSIYIQIRSNTYLYIRRIFLKIIGVSLIFWAKPYCWFSIPCCPYMSLWYHIMVGYILQLL